MSPKPTALRATNADTPCTPAQRDYVCRLLRKSEYDMLNMSLPHRALATRARLPVPEAGTRVGFWLNGLTKAQAGDLINALLREQS